jgi:hypothetical protein
MLTAGGTGNALTFDGSTNYVDCGSGISSVLGGTNLITVEAWVNTNSTQNLQTIAGNYFGSMQFLLRIDNMKPVFWVSNGGFSNATGLTTIPQNTWVHIAGTWDGSMLRVYYNGVQDGSNPYGGTLPTVTQSVKIGASLMSEKFSGSIDEVRIWNVAKTQTEIQNNMNKAIGPNAAGLIAYYKLNEGTGASTADATLNANNGTLINAPAWMVPSTSPVDAVTYLWSPNGETTNTIAAKTNGTYSVTVFNTNGCSGTSAGTVVTVKNSTASTDIQTACESFTWMDGNTYTASNTTATHTIANAAGCDSVITLNLTIKNNSSSTDVQTACESFTWMDGNTYTATNTTATHTIPNAAGCDSVITLNLTIKNNSSSTDVQTACESFTWMDGTTYTSSNNTSTYTIPNTAGCDSVITLNLTINTVDASVTSSNETITANASGAVYQWLDCNNSFAPVANETNQSFNATANGNYAVEITENGCTDTSSCTLITTVSVQEMSQALAISIFPNPANDVLNVTVESPSSGQSLFTITNAAGQSVHSEFVKLATGKNTLRCNVKEFARGVYFVKMTTRDGVYARRVVVQ